MSNQRISFETVTFASGCDHKLDSKLHGPRPGGGAGVLSGPEERHRTPARAVLREENMKTRRCVVTGLVVLGCLAMAATDVVAGKPPTPTPTPTPTPCTTCTIAYVQVNENNGERDLMLMNEDGSNTTSLYAWPGDVEINEPAWSPDGDWIAFNSRNNTNGDRGMYVIGNDGTGPILITPRCSYEGGRTKGRIFGPSWQPVGVFREGVQWFWVVYADGLSPIDGSTCSADITPLYLWAIEVGFGPPGSPSPVQVGRREALTYPDPVNGWTWLSPAWSGDGLHLAASRYPELEYPEIEVVVYDVDFTDSLDGLPYLENELSLAPTDPLGPRMDPSWAHWTDTLIAVDRHLPRAIWRCDVDFAGRTYQWTNLTPDIDTWFSNPRYSGNDQQIVALKGGTQLKPSAWGIWVGTVDPFAGLVVKTGRANTWVMQPDWRR